MARAPLGRTRQGAIYSDGVGGTRPVVPTDPAALAEAARRAMSTKAWAYVDGGAGEGLTMSANRAAFGRHQLVPRMAHGAAERDLTVEVLGRRLPAPVLLAPVGALGLVRRDSDLEVARAAAATGLPYIITSQGCSPMEAVGAAMGSAPRWFQLYWSTDEDLVDSFLERAERTGAEAVVVTLDTTTLGWRPQDLNLGSLPFAQGIGLANYTSDPRFAELVRERLAAASPDQPGPRVSPAAVRSLFSISREHPGDLRENLRSPVPRAAVQTFLDIYSNPGLSWDHLATLRGRTRLPILLKGILHPEDAARAVDLGVDGIIVSNHGGRQVDGSVASLDALIAIRERIGPDLLVLLDSGIRTGTDVVKAVALGADAVCVGRPYAYGLALDGAAGVQAVLDNLLAELDITMALVGAGGVADLGPHLFASSQPRVPDHARPAPDVVS